MSYAVQIIYIGLTLTKEPQSKTILFSVTLKQGT